LKIDPAGISVAHQKEIANRPGIGVPGIHPRVDQEAVATEPTTAPTRSARPLYVAYCAGITTNALSTMMKVGVPLWAISLSMSSTGIGFAVGALGVMPFLFAIHGGVLMDRFGTRRVNVLFAAVATIAILLYPVLPWGSAVIALQLIIGLPVNMGWMGAQTMIAHYAPGDTTIIGRFTIAARVGNLIAPVLTGVAWDLSGPVGMFLLMGSVAFASLLSFLLSPKLTKSDHGGAAVTARDLVPRFSEYVQAFSMIALPAVAFVVAITFLRISSSAIQGSFYVVYLQGIGITGTLIGVLMAVGDAFGLFGAGVAGWIEKKLRPHWTALLFIAMSIAFVSITPFLGGLLALLFAASALRGWGQGLSQPVMFSILSRAVTREQQGRSIGLRSTANRLASMGVPPLMGIAVDWVGLELAFAVTGGVLIGLAAILGLVISRIRGFKT
jgi:predicted MFS family arabinose efflux permease